MKTVCLLCAINLCTMAKKSEILTRGVLLSDKKKLQRIAKSNRLSLNSIMLTAIDCYLSVPYVTNKMEKNDVIVPPQKAFVKNILS